jgi:ubiquinone/menaquinone biosynthesis C-methylase UbiE
VSSKEYFDDVAAKWDEMRTAFFSEAVRDKALSVAGVRSGELAADLGAGTGFITEALLNKGLKVIAVDQSPEMLKQLESKLHQDDSVDCRLGGADSLPLADGEVDYVFANMYLHHVESPLQAVKEIARVLRPGGVMAITDLDEHDHQFLLTEHHDRWPGFTRNEVQHWLAEAGFEESTIESAEETCCATSECGSTDASISIFLACGRK